MKALEFDISTASMDCQYVSMHGPQFDTLVQVLGRVIRIDMTTYDGAESTRTMNSTMPSTKKTTNRNTMTNRTMTTTIRKNLKGLGSDV